MAGAGGSGVGPSWHSCREVDEINMIAALGIRVRRGSPAAHRSAPGGRAEHGVQAGQRRRARLAGPGRLRPADRGGSGRVGARSGGHARRGQEAAWGCATAPSVFEAAEGADLVLHLTEWSDYRAIDPAALAAVVARRVIIDARCCLDAALWREADWTVHVLGRP